MNEDGKDKTYYGMSPEEFERITGKKIKDLSDEEYESLERLGLFGKVANDAIVDKNNRVIHDYSKENMIPTNEDKGFDKVVNMARRTRSSSNPLVRSMRSFNPNLRYSQEGGKKYYVDNSHKSSDQTIDLAKKAATGVMGTAALFNPLTLGLVTGAGLGLNNLGNLMFQINRAGQTELTPGAVRFLTTTIMGEGLNGAALRMGYDNLLDYAAPDVLRDLNAALGNTVGDFVGSSIAYSLDPTNIPFNQLSKYKYLPKLLSNDIKYSFNKGMANNSKAPNYRAMRTLPVIERQSVINPNEIKSITKLGDKYQDLRSWWSGTDAQDLESLDRLVSRLDNLINNLNEQKMLEIKFPLFATNYERYRLLLGHEFTRDPLDFRDLKTITKSVNPTKLSLENVKKLLQRRFPGIKLPEGTYEKEGKVIVPQITTDYINSFKDGYFKIPLFSNDSEVAYAEGNILKSQGNTVTNEYDLIGNLLNRTGATSGSNLSLVVPLNYIDAVTANLNYLVSRYGGIPYGSTSLVRELGVPHVSHDYDFYITKSNFDRFVKPELDKGISIVKSSDSNKTTIIMDVLRDSNGNIIRDASGNPMSKFGESGILDFNFLDPSVLTAARNKESRALQIFRQYFPEDYNRKVLLANAEDKGLLEVPKTELELFEALERNKDILSIIDSFEASGGAAFNASHEKHLNRWPELFLTKNQKTLNKAIQQYSKIVYGPNAELPDFPIEHFQDINRNIKLLKSIDFPGNIEEIAKNPEATKNAFNFWYLEEGGYTRHFVYDRSKGAFKGTHEASVIDGYINPSKITTTGGTTGGAGLDVVSGGISRPHTLTTGPAGSNSRIRMAGWLPKRNFKLYNSPEELVDDINRNVRGNIPVSASQKLKLEELASIRKIVKTDNNVTFRELMLRGSDKSDEEKLEKYISEQFPGLVSRDVSDWNSGFANIRGVYGTGLYRMVHGHRTPDLVNIGLGIGPMTSLPATRVAVRGGDNKLPTIPTSYYIRDANYTPPYSTYVEDIAGAPYFERAFGKKFRGETEELLTPGELRTKLKDKLRKILNRRNDKIRKFNLPIDDKIALVRDEKNKIVSSRSYKLGFRNKAKPYVKDLFDWYVRPNKLDADWLNGNENYFKALGKNLFEASRAVKKHGTIPFLLLATHPATLATLYGSYKGTTSLMNFLQNIGATNNTASGGYYTTPQKIHFQKMIKDVENQKK